MRRSKERWAPVATRDYARAAVVIITLVAIAAFSLAMRPAHENRAVVRVSLDRIPEERVVEFGHEMPRITLMSPVEPEVPLAEVTIPSTGTAPAAAPSAPPRPALAAAAPRRPAARRAERPDLVPDANGVLPIDFSLPEGVSARDGGVGVAKTLASEGGAATGLTIFLIGGSLIEVDRAELLAALAQLGAADKAGRVPPAGESGRLSLDRVRTAGLDLRYDAIHDRLVLRP
ncbi:hypothetical protein K3152_12100 [Qipengyuania sp. 1NDH17]|uniref:Energy transducer TonB n=1 Tax=Qipengyuania polymorpha TaxID=2867234 RepID=A0ABS7IZJ1_9SPHN|nr:hypothetical protein [Qipengyuania polymorpha]MBX7458992.1 hypothetical protein [Qipengyuania polymorpha]